MYVPDEVRKCVAFVSYISRDTGAEIYAGTAFLMSHSGGPRAAASPRDGYYWVTAKHVVGRCMQQGRDGLLRLRLNAKAGPPEAIDTSTEVWLSHPTDSTVDVAVLRTGDDFQAFDVRAISSLMEVRRARGHIGRSGFVALGDEVFFPGLFAPHSIQEDRNIPIVRTGTIAALPEGRSIKTKLFGKVEGYLVESRSIGGLSGSPVFVYLPPPRWDDMTPEEQRGRPSFWLMGLVHGHWDEDASGLASYDVNDERRDVVNMGIAVVIPVEKILEVLDQKPG